MSVSKSSLWVAALLGLSVGLGAGCDGTEETDAGTDAGNEEVDSGPSYTDCEIRCGAFLQGCFGLAPTPPLPESLAACNAEICGRSPTEEQLSCYEDTTCERLMEVLPGMTIFIPECFGVDGGTPPVDGGTPAEDGGTPAEDGGTPAEDGGTPADDAGSAADGG